MTFSWTDPDLGSFRATRLETDPRVSLDHDSCGRMVHLDLIKCGWLIGSEEWNGEINRCVEQSWGLITRDRLQLAKGGLRFADAAAEVFIR